MNYWLESKKEREKIASEADKRRETEVPLWKIIKKTSKKASDSRRK